MTCRDFSDGSSGACTTDSTTAPDHLCANVLERQGGNSQGRARCENVVDEHDLGVPGQGASNLKLPPQALESISASKTGLHGGGQRLVEATEQDGTTMLSAKLLCHFGWQVKTPAGQTSGIGWNRHQGWLKLPDAGSPRVGHEVCEAAPSSPPWAIFRLANGLGEMGVVPTC